MKRKLYLILFGFLLVNPLPLYSQPDIYEDAGEFAGPPKKSVEEEVYFYESRFAEMGLHVGARTFTGNLQKLFGTGFSVGGFFDYFFTRNFALEVSVNNSWHQFAIEGIKGTATLLDILGRAKYYFTGTGQSQALNFINPYLMAGGGVMIRDQRRSDTSVENSSSGGVLEIGGGFEIPLLPERQLYLGVKPSYQFVWFQDENDRTNRGTKLDGDTVSVVGNLTYSF